MDEPCDICGDIGVLEAIIMCSQCQINREHIYCRQPFSEDVPDVWLCQPCEIGAMGEPYDICGDTGTLEAFRACCQCKIAREHMSDLSPSFSMKTKPFYPDSWLCEACEMGSLVSPKSPNMLMSDPLGMVQKENTNPSGRGKLLKWEKIGKTGKVKYIPAQEAIMLSSGAKNFGSPSKSNMNSKSGPSKISVPISERTPIKPKVMSPKSSLYVQANPRFGFSGFPTTRNGNSLTNQVGQQEVTQASKEPKEKEAGQALRKEHFPMEPHTEAVISAVDTQNISAKEYNAAKKASSASTQAFPFPMEDNAAEKASSASAQAFPFPPIGSSGGNNKCVEPRKFNAQNGDKMNILPKDDKCVQGPALDSSWKGSFKILDTVNYKELNEVFFAHPPFKVRRRVYELSKAMPQVLLFTMIPRSNVWTDVFLDCCPGEDDIGLYFFSSNSQRSAPYICLLEFIAKQDLVMRSYVDGVELLVFTSKLLQANSQRWNEEYYFWGVFRGVKKHEAVSKHYKEIAFPIQLSECAQDNNANGNGNAIDMEIDDAQDDDANRGDNAFDMEIDMLGGKDVGRLDIAIPGRSSKRSCNSYRDEKATAISLHPEIPCVSRNFGFATQKPLQMVNNELSDEIPPGFEEIHRLNVQNKAFTKMGRDGKSLMLDGEARNQEKESGRFKSLSKVPGAGRLQVAT